MQVGSEHVENPWILVGQIATAVYFGWFLVLVPALGIIENTLMDVATSSNVLSEEEAATATSANVA